VNQSGVNRAHEWGNWGNSSVQAIEPSTLSNKPMRDGKVVALVRNFKLSGFSWQHFGDISGE
jgi:hypothetical protein